MRPRRIGYAKLGRSMPLTLAKCGTLGGDVEMIPPVKLLAERHPDVEFILIGRNTGENPADVGLPKNVTNPWIEWGPEVRRQLNARGLNHANLAVEEHQWVTGILTKITGDVIQDLDGVVMWLGQHGTTNTPLPSVKDRHVMTKPHDWSNLYGSYLLQGINRWRDVDPWGREEVLLNADPRNYVKYRDGKWPWRHPVLAQFTYWHRVKHERYGDDDPATFHRWQNDPRVGEYLGWIEHGQVWTSGVHNIYSRLEINGLSPGTPFGDLVSYDETWRDREPFGLFINEARRQVGKSRAAALEKWVLPLKPHFIHGKWSDESQRKLGVSIKPAPWSDYFPKLHSVRATFTTPSSGSGWATTKPWEAFAAGTVCFFHPDYDVQNNILGDAPDWLRSYLRVSTPAELETRVGEVNSSEQLWLDVVGAQRQHFEAAMSELRYLQLIEERLGL